MHVAVLLSDSLTLCLPIVALSAPLSALVLLRLCTKPRRGRRPKRRSPRRR
jgi:hypothetical protein